MLAALAAGVAISGLLVLGVRPAESAPEEARSADSFVDSVGVNVHLNYFDTVYSDIALVKSKLSGLGVRHIRAGGHLSDNADYNRALYSRVQELETAGVRTTLGVDPRNLGTRTIDREKIGRLAELAGPALEGFEGPNELDISGRPDWSGELRSYQKDLYEAVKSNPSTSDMPVIGPSLAHAHNAREVGDISDRLDFGNMHPYPGGHHPGTRALDDYNIANSRKMSADKPMMPSETGYHNAVRHTGGHKGVSERAASRYMPRLLLEHFNRNIPRTYAYELIDFKPDDTGANDQRNFGLLRNDGTEKPEFVALKNMLSLLDDPGPEFSTDSLDYSLEGDVEDVHQTLLQKRDGNFFLVLWQEVPSYDLDANKDVSVSGKSVTLSLNEGSREARTFLPVNSQRPTESYDASKRLRLTVPDHPLVVELGPTSGTPEPAPEPEASAPAAGALPAMHRDGAWLLRNTLSAGAPDTIFRYGGRDNDRPLMGDWNGDGTRTPGVARGNLFLLRNSNSRGAPDIRFRFGRASDRPVVGDWNGNGRDTIGMVRERVFLLKNTNRGGGPDLRFGFGRAEDTPIVGDWNGNGRDTVGRVRDRVFLLRNANTSGPAGIRFGFGRAEDTPIVGDWNDNGRDTVGRVRDRVFLLQNTNASGPAGIRFGFGRAGDDPLVWGSG